MIKEQDFGASRNIENFCSPPLLSILFVFCSRVNLFDWSSARGTPLAAPGREKYR